MMKAAFDVVAVTMNEKNEIVDEFTPGAHIQDPVGGYVAHTAKRPYLFDRRYYQETGYL